jgi:AcrR family transcriptional regulator
LADEPDSLEPRRLPTQARSRERVDRILDAAAQILIDDGYGAFKTNLIAKRAGVSIGSLYQFFPNRFAVLNALADRYRERIAETLVANLTADTPDRPWPEIVENVIDRLADQWRSDWSFHSVWLAIRSTPELRAQEDVFRKELIDRTILMLLARIAPNLPPERRDAAGSVILEVSNLLLDQSMRRGPDQDRIVIHELKTLLNGYLERLERESPPAEPPNTSAQS